MVCIGLIGVRIIGIRFCLSRLSGVFVSVFEWHVLCEKILLLPNDVALCQQKLPVDAYKGRRRPWSGALRGSCFQNKLSRSSEVTEPSMGTGVWSQKLIRCFKFLFIFLLSYFSSLHQFLHFIDSPVGSVGRRDEFVF